MDLELQNQKLFRKAGLTKVSSKSREQNDMTINEIPTWIAKPYFHHDSHTAVQKRSKELSEEVCESSSGVCTGRGGEFQEEEGCCWLPQFSLLSLTARSADLLPWTKCKHWAGTDADLASNFLQISLHSMWTS